MSFPEGRAEVLWRASNRSHRTSAAVICILEVVLRLTEVNNLHLERLWEEEQIGRFQVTMANSHGLQVAERRDDTNNHLLQLVLLPERARGLPLSEHVLQVRSAVHVLADHSDTERVIHGFIEVIAEELQNVGMALDLKELHCFLLRNLKTIIG